MRWVQGLGFRVGHGCSGNRRSMGMNVISLVWARPFWSSEAFGTERSYGLGGVLR